MSDGTRNSSFIDALVIAGVLSIMLGLLIWLVPSELTWQDNLRLWLLVCGIMSLLAITMTFVDDLNEKK